MQFIFFTLLAALVAIGVQRMSRDASGGKKAFARKGPRKEALTAQEMTQCPICKTYVIKNAETCPNCTAKPPDA